MTNKHLLGAVAWLLSFQYYIAQIFVASKWNGNGSFSWLSNTISDLGNTVCGPYGDKLVCSPFHTYMNLSFILLGATQALGSLLLWDYFKNNKSVRVGLVFFILAGLGTILVGLFPENTVSSLHILGAGLPFLLGNLTLVLIGLGASSLSKGFRVFSAALGLVGIIGLALFLMHIYIGLQIGGMERVVAYPQSIWMIFAGIYIARESLKSR